MDQGFQRAKVYSIPPNVSFLKTLSRAILDGTLLPADYDRTGAFGLADLTIYLPTQRSVQLLKESLVAQSEKPSLILPDIRALGDVDEEEVFFNPALGDQEQPLLPAMSSIKRQLILTRLISAWGKAMEGARQDLLLFPASPADAAWLATDLAELMDRVITEEVHWDDLSKLVPEEYAAFWQRSLEFLKIASEQWPAILKDYGLIDGAARRDQTLALEGRRLEALNTPIIAAGSTGTLPSTARLLAKIARHPSGCVVLPGFDCRMDEEVFSALVKPEKPQEALVSHPHYGMARLLADFIKVKPDEIDEIGQSDEPFTMRSTLIRDAMLPASMTELWPRLAKTYEAHRLKAAFAGVALLEARHDGEEAMAITVAIREFLEAEDGVCALVTPDRTLARRVALELGRFNLIVDDSAGRPLAKTPPAVLAALIAQMVEGAYDPVPLLALLKHPLAAFQMEKADVRRAARLIDLAVLRGPRLQGGFSEIAHRLQQISDEVLSGRQQLPESVSGDESDGEPPLGRLHPGVHALAPDDWALTKTLLLKAAEAFSPLDQLYQKGSAPLSAFLDAHAQVFNKIVDTNRMGETPPGTALQQIFAEADDANVQTFEIAPSDYAPLYRALLGTRTVRERTRSDPRILILGALEARLIDVDFMVLAGLDEGSWPQQTNTDAFMSRGMRAAMGLEAPERRIGLAAHDVIQALGTSRVLLSRAQKRSGTPVVRSRWLQRFMALLGEDLTRDLIQRGAVYAHYVRALSRKEGALATPQQRPNPKPPVKARPTRLSVTRVETWVRDPYALYAEYILGLKALDPLGMVPDFATRGTIVHEALDRFNQVWDGAFNESAQRRLEEIGEALFHTHMADFPDQHALWWPRFQRIAKAYVDWEGRRAERVQKRHSEVSAICHIPVDGANFDLVCKADRLDELKDGGLALIDFKTGQPPSAKTVKSGLAAQLALEAAMVQQGAFDHMAGFSSRPITELGWLKLAGSSDRVDLIPAVMKAKKGDDQETPDDLGHLALDQLKAMVRAYRNPAQGYLSRPRPDFKARYQSPYDHLARLKEWELADEGGEA